MTAPLPDERLTDEEREVRDALASAYRWWEQQVAARLAARTPAPTACECEPCPGRGTDGHGMEHCAECCFGTHVIAEIDCLVHGERTPTPAPDRDARDEQVARLRAALDEAQTTHALEVRDWRERVASVASARNYAAIQQRDVALAEARKLRARLRARDDLRERVQALAEEWERNYASMLIGGFSGCSIGADTAAKRLRALLAQPSEGTEGGAS